MPSIKIPKNKLNFLKEFLNINYICGKNDTKLINSQLKAFNECQLSINYSNPNDKSRKQRESIKFFAEDCSWLYDETQDWQGEIKLSEEMFDLIKSTAVPVSLLAATTFTNARKLDIFNYFTYQNYNLHLKQMDHYFALTDLYNLFGCGISSINEFRRVFKRIMADLKQVANLELVAVGKHGYKLLSNANSLLKVKSRRKTNEIKDKKLVINEDFKQKLEKDYSAIDIEAASIYVSKRNERGKVRHPYAYMRDVLKNPSWYQAERSVLVQSIHKMQYDDYHKLEETKRKITAQELKARLSHTYVLGLPAELRDLYEQLRVPGRVIIKNAPSWDYVCFLFWEFMTNRCIEYPACSIEALYLSLFKHLK